MPLRPDDAKILTAFEMIGQVRANEAQRDKRHEVAMAWERRLIRIRELIREAQTAEDD